MAYTGLFEYWKLRLNQGQYVVSEIKKQLQKCYYIDEAITEAEYTELIALTVEKADPTYKPNMTLKELQEQNRKLTEQNELLRELLEQQVAVNKEQDDMIISLYEGGN